MDLKLKEVAEMLQVSEKTIYRWIKDGKIPCYRINHQYRFHRDEINKWANINGKKSTVVLDNKINDPEFSGEVSLYDRLKKGGIYYRVSSLNMNDAIKNAVDIINLPISLERNDLLEILLKREAMAPTAIGNGIAFPHPREQILSDLFEESLSICFMEKPIVGYALDTEPIHSIIVILSATPETHLRILSRLSFLCRNQQFINLLRNSASREEIFEFINEFENQNSH